MRRIALLTLLLVSAADLHAQKTHKSEAVTPEAQRAASDAHSFMELFSKLERDLAMSLSTKNRASIDALVAPEFVERDAADPDHTITRDQWIDVNLKAYTLEPSGIRSMVIRSFVKDAVVSFVQKQRVEPGASRPPRDYLIVDIWVISHGQWQIASRTSALVGCQ